MQNDTNTYGYNQWFHFSVRNMKKCVRYTFKIANFVHLFWYRKNRIPSSKMDYSLWYSLWIVLRNRETGGFEKVMTSLITLLSIVKENAVLTIHSNSACFLNMKTIMSQYRPTPLTAIQNWYLNSKVLKKWPGTTTFPGNWNQSPSRFLIIKYPTLCFLTKR